MCRQPYYGGGVVMQPLRQRVVLFYAGTSSRRIPSVVLHRCAEQAGAQSQAGSNSHGVGAHPGKQQMPRLDFQPQTAAATAQCNLPQLPVLLQLGSVNREPLLMFSSAGSSHCQAQDAATAATAVTTRLSEQQPLLTFTSHCCHC